MFNISGVQCPHCGALGQIIIPPGLTIIIGPCPECEELVCILSGNCLPLDKDAFWNADDEGKRRQILDITTRFIEAALNMITYTDSPEAEAPKPERNITRWEADRFIKQDLSQLDDPKYFREIFGDSKDQDPH